MCCTFHAFGKCIMSHTHHDSVTQESFTDLNILRAPSRPHFHPGQLLIYSCLHSLVFSRMSCNCNPFVAFSGWLLSLFKNILCSLFYGMFSLLLYFPVIFLAGSLFSCVLHFFSAHFGVCLFSQCSPSSEMISLPLLPSRRFGLRHACLGTTADTCQLIPHPLRDSP